MSIPTSPTSPSGRKSADGNSQANIKLESYGLAIIDADKAIELDPNNVKVWRLETVYMKLG